jgi:restriction endonuclease
MTGVAPPASPGLLLGGRNTALWVASGMLLLGMLSALRRRQISTAPGELVTIESIGRLSESQFERLVAEGLRPQGFKVKQRGRLAGRGAILSLTGRDKKILVHCTQGTSGPLEVDTLRALYTAMMAEQATGGLAITGGVFAETARQFAVDKRIGLIESGALLELVNRARVSKPKPEQYAVRHEPYFGKPVHELADSHLLSKPLAARPQSWQVAAVRSEPTASTAPSVP